LKKKKKKQEKKKRGFYLKFGKNIKRVVNEICRKIGTKVISAGERGGLDDAFEAKLQEIGGCVVLVYPNPAKPVPLPQKL